MEVMTTLEGMTVRRNVSAGLSHSGLLTQDAVASRATRRTRATKSRRVTAVIRDETAKLNRRRVACVGDSITYGYRGVYRAPSRWAYPTVLQDLLGDGFEVVNLGWPSSTMRKEGQDGEPPYVKESSFWNRPQFTQLVDSSWDVVVVMLGTNDAKDNANGGPANWDAGLYARDYASFIATLRGLRTPSSAWCRPQIFLGIPPPVMRQSAFHVNSSVVNHVLPALIPAVAASAQLPSSSIIDIFSALGGADVGDVPASGCSVNISCCGCGYFCDNDWCDQVHPNDDGFRTIARVVSAAIQSTSTSPQQPYRPQQVDIWLILFMIAMLAIAIGASVLLWKHRRVSYKWPHWLSFSTSQRPLVIDGGVLGFHSLRSTRSTGSRGSTQSMRTSQLVGLQRSPGSCPNMVHLSENLPSRPDPVVEESPQTEAPRHPSC